MAENIVLEMLPAEGRDYSAEYSFDDNGTLNMNLTGHTKIGELFIEYVKNRLTEVGDK